MANTTSTNTHRRVYRHIGWYTIAHIYYIFTLHIFTFDRGKNETWIKKKNGTLQRHCH